MSEASDYFYGELRKYLRCAVCKSRVQKVERVFDLIRSEETVIVHCHGKSEVVTLPSELVEDCRARLDFGEAFASHLLPAKSQEALCPATS